MAFFGILGLASDVEDPVFYWATLLLSLTAVPFVASSRGKFDIFEPIYLISAIIAFYFAIRSLYLVSNLDPNPWVGYNSYQDALSLALIHTIIGYVALLVGYYGPFAIQLARKLRPLRWESLEDPSFPRIVVLYGIGFAASALLFFISGSRLWETGREGEQLPPYVLIAFSNFIYYATGISVIRMLKGDATKRFSYLFWIVSVPITITQSLIFGGRIYFVVLIVMVLVCYNYLKYRVPLWKVVSASLLVLVTVFPFLGFYRGLYTGTVGVARDPIEFFDRVLGLPGEISQLDGEQAVSLIVDGLMRRSHGIDSLALIIKYTPTLADYKYGRDLLLVPAYAFVPRAVWPTKPTNESVAFGTVYLADPRATTALTSIGQFHIGDLYRNFALPGVILGMFVLGVIYRGIYLYLAPHKNTETLRILLYILFIIWVVQRFEVDIASMLSDLLKSGIVLSFLPWFVRKRYVARNNLVSQPGHELGPR